MGWRTSTPTPSILYAAMAVSGGSGTGSQRRDSSVTVYRASWMDVRVNDGRVTSGSAPSWRMASRVAESARASAGTEADGSVILKVSMADLTLRSIASSAESAPVGSGFRNAL